MQGIPFNQETDSGAIATYLNIPRVRLDLNNQTATFSVAFYLNETAALDNKQPLKEWVVTESLTNLPLENVPPGTLDEMIAFVAYNYIINRIESTGLL